MKKLPYHVTQYSLWTYSNEEADSTDGKRESVKQLREQLQMSGADVLSNAELIALVVGTASANQRTVHKVQTLLASSNLQDLLHTDFGSTAVPINLETLKQRNSWQSSNWHVG